jgi:hypothetical protein
MRFLIAAVVAFGVMTIDFETNFKRRHDLNRPARGAFTVAAGEAGNDDALVPTRYSVATEGAPAVSPVETNDFSVARETNSQIEAEEIEEQPKKDFCDALKEAAESSDIPVAFFARLLWQESRFRSSEVSHVGAQGIAQFMPATAAEVGLDDPFDPFKALPASAKFLGKLRSEFGNLGLAAAAYNAGSGRIQKWLSGRGGLPRETRNYVRIITGNNAENWLEESRTISLRIELPPGAPCEGVGGLSKAKDVAAIPVALAPSTSDAIRKAETEAQRVAAAKLEAAAKAKSATAALRKKPKIPLKELASSRAIRKVAALETARSRPSRSARVNTALAKPLEHSRTKAAERSRKIRVASASSR